MTDEQPIKKLDDVIHELHWSIANPEKQKNGWHMSEYFERGFIRGCERALELLGRLRDTQEPATYRLQVVRATQRPLKVETMIQRGAQK